MQIHLVDATWTLWSSWSGCASCVIEENKDYHNGDNLNIGQHDTQPDFESCQSFCKTNHPSATYFSWIKLTGPEPYPLACYCKTTNKERQGEDGFISGEVSCKLHENFGKKAQRSRTRVCGNATFNGSRPCQTHIDIKEMEPTIVSEVSLCCNYPQHQASSALANNKTIWIGKDYRPSHFVYDLICKTFISKLVLRNSHISKQ